MQLALDKRSQQQVAIKFLARTGPEFDARTIARELVNHKMCALHPHIVQLQVRVVRQNAALAHKHVASAAVPNLDGTNCRLLELLPLGLCLRSEPLKLQHRQCLQEVFLTEQHLAICMGER